MVIQAVCVCGKRMVANEDLAGESLNCVRCGRPVNIPAPRPREPEPSAGAVSATPGAPAQEESVREHLWWLFIFFLFPLVLMQVNPQKHESFEDQLNRTKRSCSPEVQKEVDRYIVMVEDGIASLDDLIGLFPDKRLDGAWLPRDTKLHWLFAGGVSLLFWVLLLFCFHPGVTEPRYLIYVGLFTGTIGVFLLLTAQLIGPIALFVQFCYFSAVTGKSDFLMTLAGFTLGVGLFEEIVKFLPLFWYYRRHRTITWRMACLWGLASGAGFGIAEGVMYSGEFYNGITTSEIYLVRFASCVVLHAIWTASAGITLYHCQPVLRELFKWEDRPLSGGLMYRQPSSEVGATTWWEWAFISARIVLVVMFLHGLYDAALTREMNLLAGVTAVASFAWLAWQIEYSRRLEVTQAAVA